jgi:hypothetical protein
VASTSDTGVKGNGLNAAPKLSADGTKVAFSSKANNLDLRDADSVHDAYVKDLTTGDIVLASTSDTGVKGDSDSHSASLSGDGTKVGISSAATNMDPIMVNGEYGTYVKNVGTSDLTMASASDTGVGSNAWSPGGSASGDGTEVAFTSEATNLDPADTDAGHDVYVKGCPQHRPRSTSAIAAMGARAPHPSSTSAPIRHGRWAARPPSAARRATTTPTPRRSSSVGR